MKRLVLVTLGISLFGGFARAAGDASKANAPYPVFEGPRLANFQTELKRLFPRADKVIERPFLPRTSGGTTFTGLVNRLLGESTHSELESIDLRRYIYEAYKGDQLLGVAHSSEYENKDRPKVRVDVFYDTEGVIRDMKIGGIPENVLKEFHAKGYLSQFVGHKPEDFEIKRNRRGHISKTGNFLSAYKKPVSAELKKFFDSLVRTVRYNAAFMDVAFFITQHPNLDNDSQRLRVMAAKNGPEGYVSSTRVIENPTDGSMLLMDGKQVEKN